MVRVRLVLRWVDVAMVLVVTMLMSVMVVIMVSIASMTWLVRIEWVGLLVLTLALNFGTVLRRTLLRLLDGDALLDVGRGTVRVLEGGGVAILLLVFGFEVRGGITSLLLRGRLGLRLALALLLLVVGAGEGALLGLESRWWT